MVREYIWVKILSPLKICSELRQNLNTSLKKQLFEDVYQGARFFFFRTLVCEFAHERKLENIRIWHENLLINKKVIFCPCLKKMDEWTESKRSASKNPCQFLKNPSKVYVKKEGREFSCVILHARSELIPLKNKNGTPVKWKMHVKKLIINPF